MRKLQLGASPPRTYPCSRYRPGPRPTMRRASWPSPDPNVQNLQDALPPLGFTTSRVADAFVETQRPQPLSGSKSSETNTPPTPVRSASAPRASTPPSGPPPSSPPPSAPSATG